MHAARPCQDMTCSLLMVSRECGVTCSPGTWEALRLPLDKGWRRGTAKPEGSRPQADVVGPEGSEHRRRGMVSPSEAQTKRGEKVRRESERLIVPTRRGNPTRED